MYYIKYLLFYLNIFIVLLAHSLAGVYLNKQILVEKQSINNARSICMADLNLDGKDEIITGLTDKIGWFEFNQSTSTYSTIKEFGSVEDTRNRAFPVDMDGDNDLDILAATGSTVVWYENLDGNGTFSSPFESVKILIVSKYDLHSIYPSDIDNDGDIDVLASWGDSEIVAWFENLDGQGNFDSYKQIDTEIDRPKEMAPHSVISADLDGDGDNDVVTATPYSGPNWYENIDGQGNYGSANLIDTLEFEVTKEVYITDIDVDGDNDICAVIGNQIVYYENTNGQGDFSKKIISDIHGSNSIAFEDIDNDDDPDVIVASPVGNQVIWIENIDGKGSFNEVHTIQSISEVVSLSAYDADDDGDKDILVGSEKHISYIENLDGNGNFDEGQILIACNLEFQLIQIADTDKDGDKDFICGILNLRIIENNHEESNVIKMKNIFNEQYMSDFKITNLDQDSDEDILACYHSYSEVFWLENLDGMWNLGEKRMVCETLKWPESVYPADLDGGDDVEIVAAGSGEENSFEFGPYYVIWFENNDGKGNFGNQIGITSQSQDTRSLITADIDGDGDQDVVSSSWAMIEQVAWYENMDGQGDFGEQSTISLTANASSINATDMDNDGDLDLLFTKDYPDQIVWCENLDGGGNFGEMNVIATHDQEYGISIFATAVDLDGDEDMDVVASLMDMIVWYEKIDGENNFVEHVVSTDNRRRRYSLLITDFDNDGRSDIIAYSDYGYVLAWYQNLAEAPSGISTESVKIIDEYYLHQNHPNPFNPSTTIEFYVQETCHVILTVYDIQGKIISILIDQKMVPGNYNVNFIPDNLASGIYFYHIKMGKNTATKKMILSR